MHTGGLTLHTAMSGASLFNAPLHFCSLLAPSPLANNKWAPPFALRRPLAAFAARTPLFRPLSLTPFLPLPPPLCSIAGHWRHLGPVDLHVARHRLHRPDC